MVEQRPQVMPSGFEYRPKAKLMCTKCACLARSNGGQRAGNVFVKYWICPVCKATTKTIEVADGDGQ